MEVLAAGPADAGRLAAEHFMGARLGNTARTRRLVASAARVLSHPDGTVPQKMGSAAHLSGLYHLLACDRVTHRSVFDAHRRLTLDRMAAHPVVLVVNDTTELDYAHVAALAEALGPIGNGNRRGYICHNALAVTPGGRVLGMPCQILHRRRDVPDGEGPAAKRDDPDRESRLWVRASRAVGSAPPGSGSLWVKVSDRGSDTYEYAAHELRGGGHFVLRAAKDRCLEGDDHFGTAGDRVCVKLFDYARDLPVLGARRVQVPAVPGKRPARVADVRVSAGPVRLRAPHFARGEAHEPHLDLWVVRAAEHAPPPGTEPLEWVLLTDLPADTFGRASERVDWYERRPIIEDLHKGMKTGCGVERVQFEKPQHLEPYVALVSVAAAVLLGMRQAARDPEAEHAPARDHVPAAAVRVLSLSRHGEPRDLTVKQFYSALAELGGFVRRRAGAHPGWLTLWRGWSRLQDMIRGAELAEQAKRHRKPP